MNSQYPLSKPNNSQYPLATHLNACNVDVENLTEFCATQLLLPLCQSRYISASAQLECVLVSKPVVLNLG